MTDFSKDKYMKLISPITYFVMSNQGIRRIILYRTLFKPTFALKTKVIDSNYADAKLLQKSEMRKDIVIELSYKGFG